MPTVFISYARKDAAAATRIAEMMQQRGVSVWLDTAEIQPGDNWAEKIGRALQDATSMVVLVSDAAGRSAPVTQTVDFALANPAYKNRVVPIVVDQSGFDALPWVLKRFPGFQVADLEGAEADRLADMLRSAG